jgi:hypothetical protein
MCCINLCCYYYSILMPQPTVRDYCTCAETQALLTSYCSYESKDIREKLLCGAPFYGQFKDASDVSTAWHLSTSIIIIILACILQWQAFIHEAQSRVVDNMDVIRSLASINRSLKARKKQELADHQDRRRLVCLSTLYSVLVFTSILPLGS